MSFRRFTKVGVTSKFRSKLTDVKRHCRKVGHLQKHNLEILVKFYQYNTFFCEENFDIDAKRLRNVAKAEQRSDAFNLQLV